LSRAQRRDQILTAATEAFVRAGYAATTVEDIAGQVLVSRVIVYRHFAAKADIYRAALGRACARLEEAVGTGQFTSDSINALLCAAASDPAGFRLLFEHAPREPEFRADVQRLRCRAQSAAHEALADVVDDPGWREWAAALTPKVATEAILAWLNAGQPDADRAAGRIQAAVAGIVAAASTATAGAR
jgi:AcrR family transcriptional regulator